MARGAVEWGRGGAGGKFCCSFKRITVVVCCVNLVAALLVLRTFYTSFYLVSSSDPFSVDQLERIQESIRVRRDAEPVELVRAVRKLRKELLKEEKKVLKLPQPVKQKLANEILQKLRCVKDDNVTEQGGGWSFHMFGFADRPFFL
ncbi:hypothetical protein MUK42_15440 [Musa troglodytarum]|uniref:Uncharacterized protein n=1 Tax=Musa troglodytarum TaxID=320322 RepID=A0A9E7H1C8_9LILI|nr:hypothetical protein MUK42_15440 [Musa troglodytarum]